MYVPLGGLSEFGVLHPSLCEISVPVPRPKSSLPPPLRASTPGNNHYTCECTTDFNEALCP